jgi:hypothetical protein
MIPDITPPDFLLWGFLKERIYSNNPRSTEDLKHNTEQVVAGIDQQTLRKVAKTTVKRVNAYLQEGLVGLSRNEKMLHWNNTQ